MAKQSDLEHRFLDLKGEDVAERTFLGGLRLGTRSTLFWVLGFAALIALGVIYIHVDKRIVTAIDEWRAARDVGAAMTRVQSGLARAEVLEKTYVLDHQRDLADAFSAELTRVGTALDGLYQFPQAASVRQHIATLRDGLVQYGQQFSQFVTAEEALGLSSETGISPRLQNLTDQLKGGFKKAGFANLADQIDRIVKQGRETLRTGSSQAVAEIRERYRTLFAFLKATAISARQKPKLQQLLNAHQTDLNATINSRFALENERRRFGEILAYVAPSMAVLERFASDLDRATARQLDRARSFARLTLSGATAGIMLWFIFAGLLLFRSVIGPVRALADAAARIAAGDRTVRVPVRGNRDASGQIARAMEKWLDTLADYDALRRELDQTRTKLEHAALDAERKVQAAADAATAALRSELAQPDTSPEPEPAPQQQPQAPPNDMGPLMPPGLESAGATGPISSISRQLTHFSEYVTAAAHDVERTEALIRSLGEATSHIEVLGNLVTAVRDQINLLAFRATPTDYGPAGAENLIPFNAEGARDGPEPTAAAPIDPLTSGRLDAIRESTERAERTLQAVRLSMDNVNRVAQDIATTASTQALDATNKLLSQSQYLQNMLDDVMAKIHPNGQNRLTPPQPGQQPGQAPGQQSDPSSQYRAWPGPPPRKT